MDSVTTSQTMLGCCVQWTSANSVFWHGTSPAPSTAAMAKVKSSGYFPSFCSTSYSSGAVYTWDICDEFGPVRLHHPPSPLFSTSLIPPPLPTCCALTAGWAAVGTEQGLKAPAVRSYYSTLPLLLSAGHLKLFDVDTCSQVFSLSGLGTLSSVSLDNRHHITALAAAHHHYTDAHSEITVMVVGGGGEGERRTLPTESKVAAV